MALSHVSSRAGAHGLVGYKPAQGEGLWMAHRFQPPSAAFQAAGLKASN